MFETMGIPAIADSTVEPVHGLANRRRDTALACDQAALSEENFRAEIDRDRRNERRLLLKEVLVLAALAAFMLLRSWII